MIGAPAVEPLIAALKNSDENVRRQAAEALGMIGDVRAVEPLLNTLKDRNLSAIKALGQIGDVRAVEPLAKALSEGKTRIRRFPILVKRREKLPRYCQCTGKN